MARLPQPGGDNGDWGNILNEYLLQAHKTDGSIKDSAVTASTLAPNSVTASSIADGSINETLLDASVQSKINTSTPDATSSIKGLISLNGVLSGTASEPTLAAGVIEPVHVSSTLQSNLDSAYAPAPLSQDVVAKLPASITKESSNTSVGILNWVQDSPVGYLMHMTLGANSSTSNAAMAIGTDRGNGSGLLISHKNSGRGMEIGVQPGSGMGVQIQARSSSFPMRVQHFPGGGAVSLRATSGAGYSDGVSNTGSATFTSATAAFAVADVGKTLTQLTSRGATDLPGSIPSGATISAVISSTQITMSAASTATGTGILFEVGGRAVPDSQVLLTIQDENSATLTTASKDGIIARGTAVTSTPLRVNQKAGQTAPIFAVYDSSSSLLTYVGAKGHLMSGVKTPIVSGDLNFSRMGFWLDDTPGATKVKFAAKDSAGTFKTGEILLS